MLTMHRNGHQVTLQDTDYLMSCARTGPNASELNSVGIECELNNTDTFLYIKIEIREM